MTVRPGFDRCSSRRDHCACDIDHCAARSSTVDDHESRCRCGSSESGSHSNHRSADRDPSVDHEDHSCAHEDTRRFHSDRCCAPRNRRLADRNPVGGAEDPRRAPISSVGVASGSRQPPALQPPQVLPQERDLVLDLRQWDEHRSTRSNELHAVRVEEPPEHESGQTGELRELRDRVERPRSDEYAPRVRIPIVEFLGHRRRVSTTWVVELHDLACWFRRWASLRSVVRRGRVPHVRRVLWQC